MGTQARGFQVESIESIHRSVIFLWATRQPERNSGVPRIVYCLGCSGCFGLTGF